MQSISLLVLQNASIVLLIRHSRTTRSDETPLYASSVAVCVTEAVKLLLAFVSVLVEQRRADKLREQSLTSHLRTGCARCFGDTAELLKMAIPGGLYALQNNLGFFALSNLPSAVYHVSYQARILSTALIGSVIFNKRLSALKWLALALLTAGVSVVHLDSEADSRRSALSRLLKPAPPAQHETLGFLAVGAASLISGIAGNYFEYLLRGAKGASKPPETLWVRNVQLAAPCLLFALLGVYFDASIATDATGRRQYLTGFTPLVWAIVANSAVGGLLVAIVVRNSGAVAKGFATSLSIVRAFSQLLTGDFMRAGSGTVSTVVSAMVSGQPPGRNFSIGAALVVVATTLYSAS